MEDQQKNENEKLIDRAHAEACDKGEDTYEDPVTGETVFTRAYLLARGWCCQQGCRHCPFGDSHIVIRFKNPSAG
ncbi:MAG: hypothetical protein FGM27_06880 [Candidatus Omnitrophica bacterium]|nr:hypothetical protein [Candidatus Omnitrophota bacterium]